MTEVNLPTERTETEIETSQHLQNGFMENFRECYKLANVFAKSTLIPQQYQNKPEDCVIAIEMANRIGVPFMMVMQSLYVVKGKPTWSGQACMTFIRAKFADVTTIYTGEKGTDTRGCYIKAVKKNGEVIEGIEVTISMAKSEGWLNNPKWKHMPELMLAYRAATFFARVHCPEVLMGITTEGESEDSAKEIEKAPDPFGK